MHNTIVGKRTMYLLIINGVLFCAVEIVQDASPGFSRWEFSSVCVAGSTVPDALGVNSVEAVRLAGYTLVCN